MALFRAHWQWTQCVRSLGVCVSGLCPQDGPRQLGLFDDGREERALALERTLLRLRGPLRAELRAARAAVAQRLRRAEPARGEMPAFVRDSVWEELAAKNGREEPELRLSGRTKKTLPRFCVAGSVFCGRAAGQSVGRW